MTTPETFIGSVTDLDGTQLRHWVSEDGSEVLIDVGDGGDAVRLRFGHQGFDFFAQVLARAGWAMGGEGGDETPEAGAVFPDDLAADLRSRADEPGKEPADLAGILRASLAALKEQRDQSSGTTAAGPGRAADLVQHGDRPAVATPETAAPAAPALEDQ